MSRRTWTTKPGTWMRVIEIAVVVLGIPTLLIVGLALLVSIVSRVA